MNRQSSHFIVSSWSELRSANNSLASTVLDWCPAQRALKEFSTKPVSWLLAWLAWSYAPAFFSIFAHVSFSGKVRLNTSFSAVESGSRQKYPTRSNWYGAPTFASASESSNFASATTSRELGFTLSRKLPPSGTSWGFGFENSLS